MGARFKSFVWSWRGVWITAPSIAIAVILLRLTGALQAWEWSLFDLYTRSRPQLPRDERVVIVGVDENDLREIGQAFVPDRVYARVIEKLKAMNPRAIGLDIYRDLPVPPGHQELVEVFKSTPNLIGVEKVVGERARQAVAASPTLKEQGQIGANDVLADSDSVVRRGLIYLIDEEQPVYSFSFYLALLYLDAEGISPHPPEDKDNPDVWRLGDSLFKPFESNDGGYIGANDRGYQVIINYRGGNRSFETVSLTDILQDRVSKDWGRDRVVLIGAVSESANDLFPTPHSVVSGSLAEPMTGVEIHANLVSQFLSAALNNRPLIQSWTEWQELLWILFWSGMGASLTWHWNSYHGKKTAIAALKVLVALLALGGLLGSTYFAFTLGWWLPVVPPLLALVGSSGAIVAYTAHNARKIRQTFGRYLTDEVVANLLESPEGLKLGGKRQKVTILTSDLRGFTALSERLPPEKVVAILNIYLKSMLEVIRDYQGTIDKFMGDGILVLFGAPTAKEDDGKRAIACAIAMQQIMDEVNERVRQLNLPSLEMGIGINTGEVVIGNIGSELHTEYTGIGSHINLAFRIETYTTGSQVLISEATLQEVGASTLLLGGQKQVQPKGVKQPIFLYEVDGIRDRYNLFLQKQEEKFIPLEEEIPLLYQVLEGKQVSGTIFRGNLIKLSQKGAEVRADKEQAASMPPVLSNLKLNFLGLDERAGISEDNYAKVLNKPATQRTFYVHFTFTAPDVATKLNTLLGEEK
ncbi:adenylate/guanylate cyclase domain-containing protein [Lusitaniella coriacea LEGE 07157]|uniref:Adenylate/guanylate cyclase domain-containing protein n=1 Tax=Lusitaniella coriacea LEGE 07157 TaxID=945747 RepID=A0A8J7DY25_9CYAN|nr:adenylate/guanylate cyclase domain-containing protein [Lusitaniella coriacea]MBE9117185.1 adenylate/guanylate cyclase domain-containing protein [Lusitaniella coriacea LEGE 07157]